MMVSDVATRVPPGTGATVLDVGCFNGWLSYLFGRLGYRVSAADAYESPDQERLLSIVKGRFIRANLNDLDVFRDVTPEEFDAVLIGEVIEHVLNHPLGLLRTIHRITRPGGVVVINTPNPSTLWNAARMLFNRYSMVGTKDFISLPKADGNGIISKGEIHYREYLNHELRYLVTAADFEIVAHSYFALGSPRGTSLVKRGVKTLLGSSWLLQTRLFGSQQQVVAVRT